MKFLVKLAGDFLHGVAVRRRRLKREIFPVLLKGERAIVQILVRHDGEIEQRSGVIRPLVQRRFELLGRLLIATPLDLHEAKAIPGFRQMRVEFESLAQTFLTRIGLAGAGRSRTYAAWPSASTKVGVPKTPCSETAR